MRAPPRKGTIASTCDGTAVQLLPFPRCALSSRSSMAQMEWTHLSMHRSSRECWKPSEDERMIAEDLLWALGKHKRSPGRETLWLVQHILCVGKMSEPWHPARLTLLINNWNDSDLRRDIALECTLKRILKVGHLKGLFMCRIKHPTKQFEFNRMKHVDENTRIPSRVSIIPTGHSHVIYVNYLDIFVESLAAYLSVHSDDSVGNLLWKSSICKLFHGDRLSVAAFWENEVRQNQNIDIPDKFSAVSSRSSDFWFASFATLKKSDMSSLSSVLKMLWRHIKVCTLPP